MPDGLGDIRTRECRDPHDRQEEDDDCANGHPGDLNRRIAEHWRTVHQLGGEADHVEDALAAVDLLVEVDQRLLAELGHGIVAGVVDALQDGAFPEQQLALQE